MKWSHPAWIEIDVVQWVRNLCAIRKRIGTRRFCLPVKANAYGHGLSLAKIAQEIGIDLLGVSCLQEAARLRSQGISMPVLVFGAIHEDQIDDLLALDVELTISSKYKAELVARRCIFLQKKCRVHIEVDTGMQRTGVRPESVADLVSFMDGLKCFELIGLYSHLATSNVADDPFAKFQIAAFRSLTERFKVRQLVFHLANSGGIIHYPESYFDMVRPGLLCYGYCSQQHENFDAQILPCFCLKAKISYFKVVKEGEGIGYGRSYLTRKQTRIVTIPIGYGDGYRRSLAEGGKVLIRGKRFPIVGAICMDQLMVDIGEREAYVGDEVVLIGKQGKEEISLWEICHQAQSIPYEMLCGFNDRLPRVYLDSADHYKSSSIAQ